MHCAKAASDDKQKVANLAWDPESEYLTQILSTAKHRTAPSATGEKLLCF